MRKSPEFAVRIHILAVYPLRASKSGSLLWDLHIRAGATPSILDYRKKKSCSNALFLLPKFIRPLVPCPEASHSAEVLSSAEGPRSITRTWNLTV